MSAIIGILVGLVVLVRVIGRQVTGSVVTQRALMAMPAILLIAGALTAWPVLAHASTGEITFVAMDAVVLVGMGFARGASIRLTQRDEGLWQKGTKATLALWLLTIALRVGATFGAAALFPDGKLSQATIVLTVGLTIAAQNAMVYRRALDHHIPLAVERA